MLQSVLYGRDYLLDQTVVKNNTVCVWPNVANMYLTGSNTQLVHNNTKNIDFLHNCYGFNLKSLLKQDNIDNTKRSNTYDVIDIQPNAILTNQCCFKHIDLMTIHDNQLDFNSSDIELTNSTSNDTITIDCFIMYFDTLFDSNNVQHKVILSTAPTAKTTHWHQTIFYLHKPVTLRRNDILLVDMICKRRLSNQREYNVDITYRIKSNQQQMYQQSFIVD